jgi:hypothetical protein
MEKLGSRARQSGAANQGRVTAMPRIQDQIACGDAPISEADISDDAGSSGR